MASPPALWALALSAKTCAVDAPGIVPDAETSKEDDPEHLPCVACIDDKLNSSNWMQYAYAIVPPGECNCSHHLYLQPTSQQVVDRQGQPVPEQKQYQEWLVPGMNLWGADGQETQLTVELVALIAECASLLLTPPAGTSAATWMDTLAPQQPQLPVSSLPATSTEPQETLQQQQQQQQQHAVTGQAADDTQVSNNTAPGFALGQSAALLGTFTPHQAETLLLLVISSAPNSVLLPLLLGSDHSNLQQALNRILQAEDYAVALFLSCLVRSKQKPPGSLVFAALAADDGILLLAVLRATCSSRPAIVEAAANALQHLFKSAEGKQYLKLILEAEQGVELLSKAVLDQHNLADPLEPAQCGGGKHYMTLTPVARAITILDPQDGSQPFRLLKERCFALLCQHPQNSPDEISQQVSLLLVLSAWKGDLGLGMEEFERVLPALLEGAVSPGPSQKQCLSTLLQLAQRCWLEDNVGPCPNMQMWLTQYDLAPLLSVMLQQALGPEADLAAHLMDLLYAFPTGEQVLHGHVGLLVEILGTTSSTWVASCILNLLCLYASSAEEGFTAICSNLGPIIQAFAFFSGYLGQYAHPDCEGSPIDELSDQHDWMITRGLCLITKVATVFPDSSLVFGSLSMQLLLVFMRNAAASMRPKWFAYHFTETAESLSELVATLAGHPMGAQLLATCSGIQVFNTLFRAILDYIDRLQPTNHSDVLDANGLLQRGVGTLSSLLESSAAQQIPQPESAAILAYDVTMALAASETLANLTCLLSEACLTPGLVVSALGCFRSLALLPCGAYQCINQLQELQQRLAGVSETLSSTDRQQCEQDLAEVERRTYILQARLVITPAQARRDMQEAAVGCAQLHEQRRRDPYDENLQSLFVVAAIRVVSLAVYEEIAEHLCKSIMVEGGDDSPAEGAAIMA